MATINQYISDLRSFIKESGRSADVYTDTFLYSLLQGARSTLLAQQASNLNHISEWNWQQFPLKLIRDKSHMIGCVTVGCDIMRSEYKIPRPISSNIKDLINVYTFDYSTIILESEQSYRNSMYDDIKSKQISASIINGYLIIWNRPMLKNVLVNGVWDNIVDWATIPQCDVDGNYTMNACFDIINSEFRIDSKLKIPMYQIVLDKLFPTLNKIKDITNDSNAEIKA